MSWAGFDSRQEQSLLFFATASRAVLEPTQPPIQRVPEAPSPRIKRLGCDTSNLAPRLRMRGVISPITRTSSWRVS